MNKVILVASGKGGVGKTFFSTNLGTIFAERGLKVLLIDMNLGLRNLDMYLGLENYVVYDIADVIDGIVSMDKALIRHKKIDTLHLLAATQNKEKFTGGKEDFQKLIDYYREKFDVIIIDGPAGLNNELEIAAVDADMAVIVTTPEYVSLRDADLIDKFLRDSGIPKRTYIINKADSEYLRSGIVPTLSEVYEMMMIPLIGIVQNDENIHLSTNKGIPIVTQKNNYIESNFNKIVDRVVAFW